MTKECLLGLHNGRPTLHKPSALKREHPALQNILGAIFAVMDPDPHFECETGSSNSK
jgi:hypothetical protein